MTEPIVGIIGGMGPEATIELMQRIVSKTPAADDQDHIHMIVDNNPKVPSRIQALLEGTGDNPAPVLMAMARRLEQAGADFLVIPCNTAHYYWPDIHRSVGIPVWHLVDLTLQAVKKNLPKNKQTIGLLASPALEKIGLYQHGCDRQGLSLLYPTEKEKQLEVIRAVKKGRHTANHIAILNALAAQLVASGADAIVLGCTEFSILHQEIQASVPVIDAMEVLADEILIACKGEPFSEA